MQVFKSSLFTTALFSAAIATGSAAAQQFTPAASLKAPSYPPVSASGAIRTAAGDLDGDGDQDIVIGIDSTSPSGSTLRFIRNGITIPATGIHEAYGAFVERVNVLSTNDRIFDVDVFDADNDGDNDIVYVTSTVSGAASFSQVALMRQTAPGVFLAPVGMFGTFSSIPVTAEIADLNGDGRMDIVLGTAAPAAQNGQGPIVLTQTIGGFQAVALPSAFVGMTSTSIAIGDIDGDGDMDIVAGNRSAQGSSLQNVLYRNVGGSFVQAPLNALPLGAIDTTDVLLADFYGTGLPELVVVDGFGSASIYPNNGGVFGAMAQVFNAPSAGGQAATSDIDLDGDLDLAVSYPGAGVDTLMMVNNGTSLIPAPSRLTQDGAASSITFVDVDRDGDPDLLRGTPFAQFGSAYRVQINLHRQIDAPRSAPRGSTYVFDYYDRPGYGAGVIPTVFLTTDNLVPRVALAPFGEFGVDPNTVVITSTLPQAASGKSTLTLTLPSQGLNPGDTWYWQWLHTPAGGLPTDGRLTNVLPLTFL